MLVWIGLLGAADAYTGHTPSSSLGWLNGVINLASTVAKALLVMIFFMHSAFQPLCAETFRRRRILLARDIDRIVARRFFAEIGKRPRCPCGVATSG